jgi:hypothetical protein
MARQFAYYRVNFDNNLRCALCMLAENIDESAETISFLDPVEGRCYQHHSYSVTGRRLAGTEPVKHYLIRLSAPGFDGSKPYLVRAASVAEAEKRARRELGHRESTPFQTERLSVLTLTETLTQNLLAEHRTRNVSW